MVTHYLRRMAYPKVFFRLAKVPDDLITASLTHVDEWFLYHPQTCLDGDPVKTVFQMPSRLLETLENKFVLLRFVPRVAILLAVQQTTEPLAPDVFRAVLFSVNAPKINFPSTERLPIAIVAIPKRC